MIFFKYDGVNIIYTFYHPYDGQTTRFTEWF
jgi:hypothetical protein